MEAFRAQMEFVPLWAIGLAMLVMFSIAAGFGRWLRASLSRDHKDAEPGLVVSASLGLLALLLGFTVSMAVGRFDGRRAAILQEANAVGTFFLRTDLMPPESQRRTLAELDRYMDARLRVSALGERADHVAEAKALAAEITARMWREVVSAEELVPDQAVKALLVESANAMFDAASARDASLSARLPPTLVVLLLLFPVASLVLIGYVSGDSVGAHLMASTEMIVLLTLVLLLIFDLDRPRSGTIHNNVQQLEDVSAQVKKARAAMPATPVS